MLFSLLVVDPQGGGGRQEALAAAAGRLLATALEMSGGTEYCYGIGLKLAHLAAQDWGEALPLVRRLKEALDLQGLLNPGKLGL